VEGDDLPESESRNAVKLERDGRHALALLFEQLRVAGLVELGDHRGQAWADSG